MWHPPLVSTHPGSGEHHQWWEQSAECSRDRMPAGAKCHQSHTLTPETGPSPGPRKAGSKESKQRPPREHGPLWGQLTHFSRADAEETRPNAGVTTTGMLVGRASLGQLGVRLWVGQQVDSCSSWPLLPTPTSLGSWRGRQSCGHSRSRNSSRYGAEEDGDFIPQGCPGLENSSGLNRPGSQGSCDIEVIHKNVC